MRKGDSDRPNALSALRFAAAAPGASLTYEADGIPYALRAQESRVIRTPRFRSCLLPCVGEVVRSCQDVLLQYMLHLFGFFKQRAVSRVSKGVEPLHGRP